MKTVLWISAIPKLFHMKHRFFLTRRNINLKCMAMVEIPDPLPDDISGLQKLARELIRENQQIRRRMEKMEQMIGVIERLVDVKEQGDK